jgi:hypothetical protein
MQEGETIRTHRTILDAWSGERPSVWPSSKALFAAREIHAAVSDKYTVRASSAKVEIRLPKDSLEGGICNIKPSQTPTGNKRVRFLCCFELVAALLPFPLVVNTGCCLISDF